MKTGISGVTRVVIVMLLAFCWTLPAGALYGAELTRQTIAAWTSYVSATESRIAMELASRTKFLSEEFQPVTDEADDKRALFKGEILTLKMESRDPRGAKIDVPDGMIHHIRGNMFIPGVDVAYVLDRVANPVAQEIRQEDVLQSKVLSRSPDYLKIYLKLQRSKIVTVVYNTEHEVRYQKQTASRAWSTSKSLRIAELTNPNSSSEQEKPEGRDRGFLWRLNSYWRYQQAGNGVIVECESISLSRSIPSALVIIARPIINMIARESMQRTLESMRSRIQSSRHINEITRLGDNLITDPHR